ncbi:MAG: hemolysin family protein [marine benthic group bacterium]|nr:hemolysin family protein [Gemmatimonadota bacterium]
MTLLLLYVALALGVSFLCSIMEAVLLSVPPSYVARLEAEGSVTGRRLAKLKAEVDRPLAAILSLNTIAHTVGAAGAGAQAAVVFGSAWFGVFSAILTFLILVLSEIVPKTLGALYWRALVPWVVRLLVPVMLMMWPLVMLSRGITWLIARGEEAPIVERAEIAALAELGAREGVLRAGESRIVRNLFRFGQIRAEDIMTPRTVLVALPEDETTESALHREELLRFSRLPVYSGSLDNVTGFVLKSDVLLQAARSAGRGQEVKLSELRRPLLTVPESLPLPELFDRLMADGAHLARVVDEFGGTAGLVTMEDVFETLIGLEIVDEVDTVEDMREHARQEWLRRARRLGLVSDEGTGSGTPDDSGG